MQLGQVHLKNLNLKGTSINGHLVWKVEVSTGIDKFQRNSVWGEFLRMR